MGTERIKTGLIGAGRIGRIHAENLAFHIPDADLCVIADPNVVAAKELSDRLRIPRWTARYEEVLADPDIRAVVICSPTDLHACMIEEAAAAGKQIFCEKPIAHDLAKIDRALDAVSRAGISFQVGFNRRFDASFRRVRRAVQEGEIGAPHRVHITSRDPAPPPLEYIRVSGGIFLDMTIHDFDMARFLIGSEVDEIYASGGCCIDPAIGEAGDLDTALVVLKFSNGVIGSIDNSRKAVYGYDQRVEVFGSQGSIQTGNHYPNAAVISGSDSIHRDLPYHFFTERYAESFRIEMRDFMEAVWSNRPTPVSGADGRAAAVMALAARKSYQENRPVKLAEV